RVVLSSSMLKVPSESVVRQRRDCTRYCRGQSIGFVERGKHMACLLAFARPFQPRLLGFEILRQLRCFLALQTRESRFLEQLAATRNLLIEPQCWRAMRIVGELHLRLLAYLVRRHLSRRRNMLPLRVRVFESGDGNLIRHQMVSAV